MNMIAAIFKLQLYKKIITFVALLVNNYGKTLFWVILKGKNCKFGPVGYPIVHKYKHSVTEHVSSNI